MTGKHVEVVNKTPYIKQEASYRSEEPHEDVLRELLQTRNYAEILGAFTFNAANTETADWIDGPIAINPLDTQTLHRLGIITAKGRITRRGQCVLNLLSLSGEALKQGDFLLHIDDGQVA